MKTMTCQQMGGPCDKKIQGENIDEMRTNAMKHLEEAHPEMAADIKAMPKDDPKMTEWDTKFTADYEATPEDTQ